ncbi:3-methyladenine DNA glycosylase [Actinomycetaceae bacterium TAE3-ERU4]|nr:3-methyladenine DNA glycosylase [Actinomycetaceae bacterium TAE3-ERU4]
MHNVQVSDLSLLPSEIWFPRARKHLEHAQTLGKGRRYRALRGLKEPVSDFLWEYYGIKPRQLEIWHPGVGVAILEPESEKKEPAFVWNDLAHRRWYQVISSSQGRALTFDVNTWVEERGRGIKFMAELLRAVNSRKPFLGCLGLHEWAMVYEGKPRHPLPLRLGAKGSDELTRSLPVRCTHFDAFRFFTDSARPLNAYQPTSEGVVSMEQPGCLHQNMDLLRYCLKLGPLVPGEVLLRAFEFALEIRTLDMAASPYDCSSSGLQPVKIETAEGKAKYIEQQRDFYERGLRLREELISLLARANI